jgi:hypothetical protein
MENNKDKEEFLRLLNEYASGTIIPERHDELFSLIATGDYDDLLSGHINGSLYNPGLPETILSPFRAQQILQNILSAEKKNAPVIRIAFPSKKVLRRMITAAVIIGLLLVTAISLFTGKPRNVSPLLAVDYIPKTTIIHKNTSGVPLTLEMEDGSKVILQPGSRINYAQHFAADKREVYLQGEAFFEVSKNPKRPFLVYSNNIVTEVLGTSFSIKLNNKTNKIEVNVRTGRVQVFENPKLVKPGDSTDNGVILTPNQKAVYDADKRQFKTTLVDQPVPLTPANVLDNSAAAPQKFVFDQAPLLRVLTVLEKNYGIEMVVENENLYNCTFTGDVTEQSLYTKLDIITRVINATYEIKGTRILIKGKGCN